MDIQKEREAYKAALKNLENEFFFATPFDIWLAAKREAQAVPEGYVMVPKCLYCNGYGEVGCRFEGTFTCPECNGDRINLKAVIEAQEST